MDFKDIVRLALEEYRQELLKALDGLIPQERRFQPSAESHHIDFAVWHIVRVEDNWVQRFARQTDTIWERENWHEKLGIPANDSGFGYTAEQVAQLPEFDPDDLMEYFGAVRHGTLSYIDGITRDDLARTPDTRRRPGYTIAKMFSHLIVEESQHVGQIAYLRGIQRGLNK